MAKEQKSYYELLKDPRWQKKRLEVLELAAFTCEICGSTEKTLHVHHRVYEKGRKPWEYDEGYLQCLCEDCHKNEEYEKSELNDLMHSLILSGHNYSDLFEALLKLVPNG